MANIRMKIKDSIMHYLCDDWNNHKRGRAHKENWALFDKKEGYAIWTNTDLEMVMEKVIKGIYAVDFDEYEKEIRADERKKLLGWLYEQGYLNRVDIDYDWEENSYEVINALSVDEVLEEYMDQMKKDGV